MEYLSYVVTYLVLLNIVTTYRLLKTENYEVSQKIIQFVLLWAIPFFGVFIVTFFLNQDPIVLNKKIQKFRIILKILLFPWLIKIKSSASKEIGNSYSGYEVNGSPGSGGD